MKLGSNMPIAEVELTEAECKELELLSRLKGRETQELLHEAVQGWLDQHRQEKRLAALRQARGMWKDREDLPALRELRSEWDRS